MTGIGAYYYIVWAIWLRHCLNERQDEYVLNWPSIFSIPQVILDPKQSKNYSSWNGYGNGKVNGNANGHVDREDRKSV